MEEAVNNGGEVQATGSVSEGSQPQQTAEQTTNNGETQNKTEVSEMVSRLEYNKARESERKLQSKLAQFEKLLESNRTGIDFYNKLKSEPEKFNQIMSILQAQKQTQQSEDDAWLNEYDDRFAKSYRNQNQLVRDLVARTQSLEQLVKSSQEQNVSKNEATLENTFESKLRESGIMKGNETAEELEANPTFRAVRNAVFHELATRYPDPRLASPEEVSEAFDLVKRGMSEFGKQELTSKAQPVVPPSGTKSGQIPKSDKVTSEEVTNFWSGVRQGFGWS